MGGDYTRLTFRPSRDYAGVLRQQGRVGLDADHNELVEILDRRWRAESIDIMGRRTVPVSNPANQDAFKITPSGPNAFTIGQGRLYLDGLLLECRGPRPHDQYDDSLGEERGSGPLPSDQQPYFPGAPAAPGSGADVTDLVYLDAWEREVTALEDPNIREIALGGPDTATRLQSVWQVRVLPDVDAKVCADPIQKWTDLITSPNGRLSSEAAQPPSSDDPCVLSPTGGYRGLENRLYRVEIHSTAQDGTHAKFKWSRDDASLATQIEAIAGNNQITVKRIGRDAVLRFRVGDWAELTDDRIEFAQRAGHMARITQVDEANRILTIAPPLPVNFLDPAQPDNHTRIRRWDGTIGVDAQGLLDVGAGPIDLEDGVRVRFGPDPDPFNNTTFRVDDYWVFAARTADGSVEPLHQAPPRGVVHHFAKLALITWADPFGLSVVIDCRNLWPPDAGCCTEVVRPGESIQAAIDRLPPTGGCVCLKTGLHPIGRPIRIAQSNVHLHGETLGAVVRSELAPVLEIASATGKPLENVTVHDIRFEAGGRAAAAMVSIQFTTDVVIRDCELVAEGEGDALVMGVGVVGSTAAVDDNEVSAVGLGVLAVRCEGIAVRRNRFTAATRRILSGAASNAVPVGVGGVVANSVQGPILIEGNQVDGFAVGIAVDGDSRSACVLGNQIQRGPTVVTPSNALAQLIPVAHLAVLPGQPSRDFFFAIHCTAAGSVIAGNRVEMIDAGQGGILAGAVKIRIDANTITTQLKEWAPKLPVGIVLDATSHTVVSQCSVCDNTLAGLQDGIAVLSVAPTLADAVQVRANRYRADLAPQTSPALHYGVLLANATRAEVVGHQIDNAPVGIWLMNASPALSHRVSNNEIGRSTIGILAEQQSGAAITGNTILGATFGGGLVKCTWTVIGENLVAAQTAGLLVIQGSFNRVSGNTLLDGTYGILAGLERDFVCEGNRVDNMATYGIAALNLMGSTHRDNRLAWCGFGATPSLTASILLVGEAQLTTVESCDVRETGLSRKGDPVPHATCAIVVAVQGDAQLTSNRVINAIRLPTGVHPAILGIADRIQALNNDVTADGKQSLIYLLGRRDLVCSGNRCLQSTGSGFQGGAQATLVAVAPHVSAVGNQIRAGDRALPSIRTLGSTNVSALGNITSGPWDPTPQPPGFVPPLAAANHIQVP
jgi:hypothetical protein